VFYEIGDQKPGEASGMIEDFQNFRTTELSLTFLCVDESPDPRPAGAPYLWRNMITIKGQFYSQGEDQMFKAVAIPPVPLRYTTDGSSPLSHGVPYNGDFAVPSQAKIIQVAGEKDGVQSVESFTVKAASGPVVIPHKPLEWKTEDRYYNIPQTEAYSVFEKCGKYSAGLANIFLNITQSQTGENLAYTLPDGVVKPAEEIAGLMEKLQALLGDCSLQITIGKIHFASGQAFLDWAHADKFNPNPRELEQK
jgi:hypothetical protein